MWARDRAGWAKRVAPVAALVVACGSRGPIENDPFRGRDASLRDVLGGDDTGALDPDAGRDAAPDCDWEEISDGLTGAGIAVLERDDRGSRPIFYAASSAHVYRSTDGGRVWEARGAPPAAVRAIAFPDAPGDILLGTADGVWVSHDDGSSFEPVSLRGLAVNELEAHPAGRDRILASVLSLGMLRSNDAAQTWTPASGGLESAANVTHVSGEPRDLAVAVAGSISNDPVFFGATNEGQLLRTTTSGASWQEIEGAGGRVFDLRRCDADPDVLYAARYYGLYRSTDGGVSFAPVAALSGPVGTTPATTPVSVDVTGERCQRVVVFMATPSFGAYVSDDAGESFRGPILDGLEVSRFSRTVPIMRANGGDGVIVAAPSGLYASSDGLRYETVGGLSEVGVGPLVETAGHLWAGTGGAGVWVLAREASRWDRIETSDLENDYVFSLLPLGGATATAGDLLVGSYGYLYGRFDGARAFTRVPTDGIDADNVFDFAILDDGTILSASQTEGIQRSDDGGRTFRFSRDGIDVWPTPIGPATDLRAITAGPAGSGVVVAGSSGRGLWRSVDRGLRWARSELGEGHVVSVRYAEAHDVYVATMAGAGVVTSPDGQRWTTQNRGLDSLDTGGISLDGERVLITAGGLVYEARSFPDVRWTPFDPVCGPPSARSPAVVSRPDGRWLFVAGGPHGVFRHALD